MVKYFDDGTQNASENILTDEELSLVQNTVLLINKRKHKLKYATNLVGDKQRIVEIAGKKIDLWKDKGFLSKLSQVASIQEEKHGISRLFKKRKNVKTKESRRAKGSRKTRTTTYAEEFTAPKTLADYSDEALIQLVREFINESMQFASSEDSRTRTRLEKRISSKEAIINQLLNSKDKRIKKLLENNNISKEDIKSAINSYNKYTGVEEELAL